VKYVALLAFNKIVLTHPYLVAQQEDVIMDCIDSPDISIRLRALDLVVGMVSSENLVSIVGQLMRQLRTSTSAPANERNHMSSNIEPAADSDDESPEVAIRPDNGASKDTILPDEYKVDVINRILEMCSSSSYANLLDFDWYIDILIQLVRIAPIPSQASLSQDPEPDAKDFSSQSAFRRGLETSFVTSQ
jgi:AP-3 complex subunit delta-1